MGTYTHKRQCIECGREIKPGERAERVGSVYVFNGWHSTPKIQWHCRSCPPVPEIPECPDEQALARSQHAADMFELYRSTWREP